MRSSKINNSPIRRDALTGALHPKDKLIRIDISKDGTTTIDKDQKMNGRGIYVSAESKDLLTTNPARLISQLRKHNGSLEIIEELKEVL